MHIYYFFFFTAKITSSAKWMIGNYHRPGFYRVNYDAIGWKAVKDQLDKDHTVCLLFGTNPPQPYLCLFPVFACLYLFPVFACLYLS